jgi:hypothetical protein
MIQAYQIAELLAVAQERLVYCQTIIAYPAAQKMRGFDTSAPLDMFFKNVCNTSFFDSLQITASLLEVNDKRVVSFSNWLTPGNKQSELNSIVELFETSGLKTVRDQVIAHVDISNHNNTFPFIRLQGIIEENLIVSLKTIQDKLQSLFCDYTKEIDSPYAPKDLSSAHAQIDEALLLAKPKLTNNFVI